MSKLSICQMTTLRWSFLEDVTGFGEAGIDGVGVWRRKLIDFGEEKGVELLRESGLGVSSVAWAGGFTGADGRSFRESVEDGVEAVRLASELNASCLIVLSGSRGGHTHNHARKLVLEAFDELLPEAERLGVSLALEPADPGHAADWSFLHTLDDALEMMDRLGDEVGLVFDTYTLGAEEHVLERIAEIAPLVRLVQLSDRRDPARSDNDRLKLGDGTLPLADIVTAFDRAGYEGWYEIDILSDELWQSDYASLVRHCREKFERLTNATV